MIKEASPLRVGSAKRALNIAPKEPEQMSKQDAITADYLRSILSYDPTTGEFRWKNRPREHFASLRAQSRCNSQFAGKIAGALSTRGYWVIGVSFRIYTAHRLAWLYMTGEWPIGDIDHIDGATANNAWRNLRAATESQNLMNSKLRADNKTGFKCVHARVGVKGTRYQVTLSALGKREYIGTFDTAEEGHEAHKRAAARLHGEFARIR